MTILGFILAAVFAWLVVNKFLDAHDRRSANKRFTFDQTLRRDRPRRF